MTKSTRSLLKKAVFKQYKQKMKIRIQQKEIKRLQRQFIQQQKLIDTMRNPLTAAGTTTTTTKVTPTVRTPGEKAMDSKQQQQNKQEAGTSTNAIDDNNGDDEMISWPLWHYRGQDRRQQLSIMSKETVMKTIEHHLVPHADSNFIHDETSDLVSESNDSPHAANLIFQRIATLCTVAGGHKNVGAYTSSSATESTTLHYRKDANARTLQILHQLYDHLEKHGIQLDRAEDHWLAKYFVWNYVEHLPQTSS